MAAAFTAQHRAARRSASLDALDAAEAAGGDIRGQQSAAVCVVAAEAAPSARATSALVDVRVEDHPEPLVEIRRLVELARAYRRMEDAEEAMTRGDLDAALAIYAESAAQQPAHHEFPFWHAVLLAGLGRGEEARAVVAPVFARPDGDRWRELVRRLPADRARCRPRPSAALLGD